MKRTGVLALGMAAAVVAVACGEKAKDSAAAGSAAGAPAEVDFRATMQHYADSVFAEVKGPTDVAKRLGKNYAVAPIHLRDTVTYLATQSRCFETARKSDPYLQGTATMWVNMSAIGSDVIQVLESDSKWTSPAGNAVVGCLNKAAANWKFDMSFGKPAAYIVQIQFKTEPGGSSSGR